jgi:hypothetical protein
VAGQPDNQSYVLLASAARTTTQTTPDQTNLSNRGCHVILDMTTVGTGSVTPKIQGKAASGVYYDLIVFTAVTTNSTNVLKVYPGITAAANVSASDFLPAIWRVVVTANNANSATYAVSVNLEA